MPDWIAKIAIPLVSALGLGGLLAVLIGEHFAKRRQKLELTLRIVEDYFKRFDDLGHAQHALETEKDNATLLNNQTFRSAGNWLHLVAKLLHDDKLLPDLVDSVGIVTTIDDFKHELANRNAVARKAKKWWPNLNRGIKHDP